MKALAQAGYIDGRVRRDSSSGPTHIHVISLLAEGRRATGLWPSPDLLVDRLLDALAKAEAEAATPQERSKLAKAREALLGVSRDVLVNVGSNLMSGGLA